MKKKKLKRELARSEALKTYVLLENKRIYEELEDLRSKSNNLTVYIVSKKEEILYDVGDQRTLYYLPRKVNDNVDFAVFFSYNDAHDYITQKKLEKSFIMKSQVI